VPVQHVATLLSSTLFLLLAVAGVILLGKRSPMEANRGAIIVLAVACLGLVNLWILVGS
jgi:hypothetical protein